MRNDPEKRNPVFCRFIKGLFSIRRRCGVSWTLLVNRSHTSTHDNSDLLVLKQLCRDDSGGTSGKKVSDLAYPLIFEPTWSKQTRTQCPSFRPFYFQPCGGGGSSGLGHVAAHLLPHYWHLFCHQIGDNCDLTVNTFMGWRWNLQLSVGVKPLAESFCFLQSLKSVE